MAIPSYLYFVVVEKHNEKLRAHTEKVHRLTNLKNQFASGRHFENILIIHLADDKTNAEQLEKSWNESYKANGQLYEFE